jgi:transcriptional regulator with XRE-family HTH domain
MGIKYVCNSGVHPIDILVGARLRERRQALCLTQVELARALGLTFQQVQKYECGTNRVSASRLFELSRILSVHINYFFERSPEDVLTISLSAAAIIARRLGLSDASTPEICELISVFSSIRSPAQRRRVLALMKNIEISVVDDHPS